MVFHIGFQASGDDQMVLDAEVLPDSPWFDGHFPENPTLPGIAQLEMAIDTIRLVSKKNLSVTGFRKVRFKRLYGRREAENYHYVQKIARRILRLPHPG